MITLTRRHARLLRGLCRRSTLGIAHRGPIPPLIFSVEEGQLCARYRYAQLAIEHIVASNWPSGGSVGLPLDALADVEGRDDSVIALEALAPDRTIARWSDRGIPQAREYPITPIEGLSPHPDRPATFSGPMPGLIPSLVEAVTTSAEDDTRYALSCLSLRGSSRSIAATDGRQVLVQRGFEFPWNDDVLVRRSPLFGSKELPHDHHATIARTETHVVIRVGAWTFWLEVVTGVRFPDVDRIWSAPEDAATRLRVDPDDARFVVDALGRLPGSEAMNAPVTVDLNGQIAVRARAENDPTPTELVLSRSNYTGTPVRFQTNRDLLGRALGLGFRELEVLDASSPLTCRDPRRIYAWQPLAKDSVLVPSDDAIRIASLDVTPTPTTSTPRPLMTPQPIVSIEPAISKDSRPGPITDPASTGLVALIREAESLHEALGLARSRSQKLVVALRRQRKQARLMAATLNTLRQLKLQEVAG
jgi:hypothetical protein